MDNVIASDGNVLPLDSMAMTFSYNLDDTLAYTEVHQGGNAYRQTLTYGEGNIVSVSRWEKQ